MCHAGTPKGGAPNGGRAKISRFFFLSRSHLRLWGRSRRGFHTTAREPKRAQLRAPALQTPPKFHEKTPRERQKKAEMGTGEKKKRNFGRSRAGRSGAGGTGGSKTNNHTNTTPTQQQHTTTHCNTTHNNTTHHKNGLAKIGLAKVGHNRSITTDCRRQTGRQAFSFRVIGSSSAHIEERLTDCRRSRSLQGTVARSRTPG